MRSLVAQVGALLAAAVLVLAACGGSSGSSGSGPDKGNPNLFSGNGLFIQPAPKDGSTNPDAAAGSPKRGGKVTFALQADDSNGYCLPDGQLDASGEQVAGSIYDTLVRPAAGGKFVPYLAQSVDHSADYKTWTIKLRPNIKFNDGSALTAQVVKDNLDAYRGLNKNHPALLFRFVFQDIADVKAVDPMTVEVDMKTPWRDFDAYLYGSRRMGIVGEAQLNDKTNCAWNLVGTGPFMLTQKTIGQRYVLKPNPNYWRKAPDGGKLPYLSELDYVPIEDSGAQMNAFSAGTVDAMMTTNADNILKLRDLASKKKASVITSVRQTELGYLMFNVKKAPFDDYNMRRAAAEVIDMGAINKNIGHDITPLATQPFAPGNVAYTTDITRLPLNLADAKKLVAAYTAAHGKPKVVLSSTVDPVTERTARLIVNYLNQAGFDASTTPIGQAQLIQTAIQGNFQMVTWRNHNGSDPGTQYVWWKSGFPTNFGGFSDPIIDCLLEVGRQGAPAAACLKDQKLNSEYDTNLDTGLKPLNQISPDDIPAIYQAISEEFKKKLWNIWGAYSAWTIGTKPNVHGIFGADNPDGSKPTQALVNGTAVETLWVG